MQADLREETAPMTHNEPDDDRLSQIETNWTDVHQAHRPSGEVARRAQQRLLDRYGRAITRYLRAALRDPHEADEVYQEFALRLVAGGFQGATEDRGRFRSYLKTSLFHMVYDHRKKRSRQPVCLPVALLEPAATPPPSCAEDEEFLDIWRKELYAAAMRGLAEVDKRTGKPLHAVLKYKVEHPGVRSFQIAAHFAGELGKPLTPEWARKRLHEAREKLGELLVNEVAMSLEHPTHASIEQELIDLSLLEFCRTHLARRGS
jgi:DNA-directed RNA polymerase specialized sigma24 family protein